jgi:hypothetical protein
MEVTALGTVLVSVGSSVLVCLITIYLTPRAQHGFWSRQRITELRLATYDKVNVITAGIYLLDQSGWIDLGGRPVQFDAEPPPLSPYRNLLALLMAAGDEVRNRFSESALSAFKCLEILVTAEGLPVKKRTQYSEARDASLAQLHAESLGRYQI